MYDIFCKELFSIFWQKFMTRKVISLNPYLFGRIQNHVTEGQLYSDNSPKEVSECSLHKGLFTLVRILQWTVVFLKRDRKFSISALRQSTAENADCCSECESALR